MNVQKAWGQMVGLVKTNLLFDALLILLFVIAINFPWKVTKKKGEKK